MSSTFPTSSSSSAFGGIGPTILGITLFETILATLALVVRCYTRAKLIRTGTWALFWAASCWTLGVAAQGILAAAVANGLGQHWSHWSQILAQETAEQAIKFGYISISLVLPAVGLSKVAAASSIPAAQVESGKRRRWILITLAWTNVVFGLILAFYVLWIPCHEPSQKWNPQALPKCREQPAGFGYFVGSLNALTDFILALYLTHLLWATQASRYLKLGMCSLLSLGMLGGACAIVRTTQATKIKDGFDITHTLSIIAICDFTELWVIFFAASVTPLWLLVHPGCAHVTSRRSRYRRRTMSEARHGPNPSFSSPSELQHPPRVRMIGQRSASRDDFKVERDIIMETSITVNHEPAGQCSKDRKYWHSSAQVLDHGSIL